MTTKITYKLNKNNEFHYILIADHAGYQKKGRDIVCAAISAITNGTINFLATYYPQDCQISCQDTAITIHSITPNPDCQLCLRLLLYQLQNVANHYPRYVEIKELVGEGN